MAANCPLSLAHRQLFIPFGHDWRSHRFGRKMDTSLGLLLIPRVISFQFIVKLQVLGLGLEVDFTFTWDRPGKNSSPTAKCGNISIEKVLYIAKKQALKAV